MNTEEKNINLPLIPDKKGLFKHSIAAAQNELLFHSFLLNGTCAGVRSVNVTKNNRYLIISNTRLYSGKTIKIIDLQKLEAMPFAYSGHTASVRLTSISSDDKYFFSASWDGNYKKFEIANGYCHQTLNGISRSPSCFLSPDGNHLYTISYDSDFDITSKNTGKCWDLKSGKPVRFFKHTKERRGPECADIAVDGEFIFTCSDDGVLLRFSKNNEAEVVKLMDIESSIRKLTVSEKYVAAGSSDGQIRVFNKFSGESYVNFEHGLEVMDVRITADQQYLISAATDGTIKCFNLLSRTEIYCKKLHRVWIWSICLFNNDKTIVSGSTDGTVAFTNLADGKLIARFYNFINDADFLIEAPAKEKAFPNGFFYTNNTELIQVVSKSDHSTETNELETSDPKRTLYLNKVNLKNLMITKLKNSKHYNTIENRFLQNQKLTRRVYIQKTPKSLKA